MAVPSFSACLAALAAAAENPAGLGSALSELRSRYVSRVGGAERFRSSGGLAMLVNLLTDPSGAAVLGSSRRGLELGLSLLANGCTEPGSRVQVRDLGGIPALISILKSVCIDSIWNRVCRALGNLALDFQNNQIIHESGAVSSLVQILQNSQDVGCLQSCLRALRILGDSPPHRLSICQLGGLAPCVQMLTSPNSDVVCEAVRAVCELSRACSLECAAALSPAVPALMTLASEEQGKTAVRQAAFGTLCNLCIQGALRPILGNAGVIKLLITEATAVQQSPTRCLPVVKALCFCCREAVNRVRVREHGGLELLLELLRSLQYRSVHYRIIVAFLYYCYDNATLSLLVSSGLTLVLAERLEECTRVAEEKRRAQTPMEAPDEEEEKGSTSYDFPQEPRKKKEQGGSSEESLRSWLLSEGYIASLDDLPPECLVERENREEPTRTMISPPGKGSRKRTSDHLCFPSPSDQSCQSPIKEIFASPSLLGPPSPAPSVVYGPEFPVLLLLSRFSQLSDSSFSLVSPPVLKGLLTYVTCHPSPLDQATRILQRLTCDPLCLGAFIRTGSICTLRARLLLQESPDGDGRGRSRRPKRARKLGDILMRNLCIQAASSYGVGLVTHMLVSGPQNDRQQCALCLPFIYRKDSPHRQNLLDGAIRLVLESLMISVDPVYYFHASECLSSILTPQTSQRRSSLPNPQASVCQSSILISQTSERQSSLLTPKALERRSSISTPQALEYPSSISTPQVLECPSSISTPQVLECPSSISTPQALEYPSSISTPQVLECPSSISTPQVLECPSSISTPQVLECPSSISTPQVLECPSSISTPQVLECPSSISTPQVLECPSSISTLQVLGCPSSISTPQVLECPSSISTPQVLECPSSISTPQVLECPSSISTPQVLECPSSISTLQVLGCPSSISTLQVLECPSSISTLQVLGCPSSISTPQVLGCPSSISTPQVLGCPSSISTPQVLECPSSISTPQVLECPSSISTPQVLGCPSSISTPQVLECPSSISTPQVLECPSSISTPQVLECPSSISTPQVSPAPPQSSSPTSLTCCYLKLFSQGQGDIVFVLDGGERLEGSRELICKSSDVFHAMLQGGYAESQQCEVRVREIPVSAFLPLLHYLHGCSQDSLCPTLKNLQQMEPEQDLVQSPLSSTLAAAGQFLLPGLQCVLENLVRDSLLTLDRLPSVYNFAEIHECAQLRRDCCMYLLKRLHPPQRRARTLFQLCEQAQDKQKLSRHLEDVLQRRD